MTPVIIWWFSGFKGGFSGGNVGWFLCLPLAERLDEARFVAFLSSATGWWPVRERVVMATIYWVWFPFAVVDVVMTQCFVCPVLRFFRLIFLWRRKKVYVWLQTVRRGRGQTFWWRAKSIGDLVKEKNLHIGWDVQLHCHIIINEDLVTPLFPLLSNNIRACVCIYIYWKVGAWVNWTESRSCLCGWLWFSVSFTMLHHTPFVLINGICLLRFH